METKICGTCSSEKILSEFYIRKDSKDGYRNDCIVCVCLKKSNYYKKNSIIINEKAKNHRINNIDKIKIRCKNYQDNNKEKITKANKEWRANNLDYVKSYQKEYKKRNKLIRNQKEKERKSLDPTYKLKHNIRGLVYKSLKRNNYSKQTKTYEILGCDYSNFKEYLESKFESWMSWENYGLYNGELNFGWDIDHIKPLITGFTEEDIIKLNHYTNLQPLCSYINRNVKRDNY